MRTAWIAVSVTPVLWATDLASTSNSACSAVKASATTWSGPGGSPSLRVNELSSGSSDQLKPSVGAPLTGSPLDPVFWAHHCMADYCWAKWNIELENDNPNDPGWNNTSWDHFVDGNGDPVSSVTAGVTTIMPLLSYQYESSAIGSSPAQAALAAADFKKLEKRVREGADMRFEIKRRVRIADQARITLARPASLQAPVTPGDFSALVESDRAKERVFASIEWAQMPPTNDFFVRVFVNLPDASINTPTEHPHFAGSFAFFGTQTQGQHGHHGKTDFLVNVTDTLKRIGSNAGSGILVSGSGAVENLIAGLIALAAYLGGICLQLGGLTLWAATTTVGTSHGPWATSTA